jgi:hypothetical protein
MEAQPEWATSEPSATAEPQPEWSAPAEQQPWMAAEPSTSTEPQPEWATSGTTQDWNATPAEQPRPDWNAPVEAQAEWGSPVEEVQPEWATGETAPQGEWANAPAETAWNAPAHDAEPMSPGGDTSMFGTGNSWSSEEPAADGQEQAPAWGHGDSLTTPVEALANSEPTPEADLPLMEAEPELPVMASPPPAPEADLPLMEAEPEMPVIDLAAPEADLPLMEAEPEMPEIDLSEDIVEQPPAVAVPPPPPPAPVMAQRAPAGPSTSPALVPGAPPPRATLNAIPAVPATSPASAVMPPVNAYIDGEHRVIIHTVEGQVKRGAIRDVDLHDEVIPLEQQTGFAPERIPVSRVKAIFFMLATGSRPPQPEGQKIRVTFTDGRQVAGFSHDYKGTGQGFFVIPADMRTNTSRIFIYRASVQAIAEG